MEKLQWLFPDNEIRSESYLSSAKRIVSLSSLAMLLADAPATVETMQAMAPQLKVGDPSNAIHAVFRRSNFKNISDVEYNALKPSLQFASLFLTTPELAGFPHAILVGAYKHVPHPENEDLDEWSYQEKDAKLSSRDMALYNLALSTLADMVVFIADEAEGIHCGMCSWDSNISLNNTHLHFGSVIRFSRAEIEAHFHNDFGEYQGDLGTKWHTFQTAMILLHEVMHAMSYARLGGLPDIPFGNNKVVETGYEWENHVFGGVIGPCNLRWSGLADDASLMIRDWPAISKIRRYKHLGYPIKLLEEEPSRIEMRWWFLPVLSEWFEQLFTTEFWTKTVPEQGAGASKVPRLRGYRVKIADDGSATFFDSKCEDYGSYGSTVPVGYMEDWDGEIVLEDESDGETDSDGSTDPPKCSEEMNGGMVESGMIGDADSHWDVKDEDGRLVVEVVENGEW
jgi:hypothetical protein